MELLYNHAELAGKAKQFDVFIAFAAGHTGVQFQFFRSTGTHSIDGGEI